MSPFKKSNAPLGTPPTCYHAPLPDLPDVQPLLERTLLCFATIRTHWTPGYIQACGFFDLEPVPPAGNWHGHSPGVPYYADVELHYDVSDNLARITLRLKNQSGSLRTLDFNDIVPTNLDPFRLPLGVYHHDEPQLLAQVLVAE